MSMLMELRAAATLSRGYVEIAIVAVSKLNQCHYCIAHHKPFLTEEGLSPEGIDRLLDQENPELDDVDRLVIEYTRAAWEGPNRVSNSVFERLRSRFSEAQIVELTLRIMLCGFFNRFNDVLRIEEEDAAPAIQEARSSST
jgi:AhpD family alkylhydroperoxidase